MDTLDYEHGRDYFKQFGAERVNTVRRRRRTVNDPGSSTRNMCTGELIKIGLFCEGNEFIFTRRYCNVTVM